MSNSKSLLLFGGRICQELHRRNFFPDEYQITYIDKMLSTRNFPNAALPANATDLPYDFIVIDFQALIEECITRSLSQEEALTWMDKFSSDIALHFSANQILLLHVFRPQYYIVKNRIRSKTANDYIPLILAIEQAFHDKIACHTISLHNCYFSFKPYGQKLALYRFEDAYYHEIVYRIDTWFQTQTDIFDTEPYFPYSLDRFLSYFDTLEKKAFNLFLDQTHILEDFVLCSSPEFLSKHQAALLYLANDNNTNQSIQVYLKKLQNQHFDSISELCQVLQAFDAVRRHKYNQKNIVYNCLFSNGFRIPSLLNAIQKWAKPQLNQLGLTHRKQITFQNYGAWFAFMQTSDIKAFENAASALHYEKDILRPVVVDLWGSCISRTNLNFDDEKNFVTSIYLFQVPPFVETTPAKYDKQVIAKYTSSWYDQIAQDELSGTFMKKLNDSPGEWLLVDFFSLSSPRAHRIGDHYFTDFRGLIADALHAEKYSFLDDMPISELQRRLRIYAQALKQRYGSHIIMIQCKRQDTFLSQESEIKKFSDKVIEKNKKANPLMYEMSQYFVQLTNCYYINVTGSYISDETGFMNLEDVHYQNACYEETLDYIRYIVKNKPKQKYFIGKKKRVGLRFPSLCSKDTSFITPLFALAFQQFLDNHNIDNTIINDQSLYAASIIPSNNISVSEKFTAKHIRRTRSSYLPDMLEFTTPGCDCCIDAESLLNCQPEHKISLLLLQDKNFYHQILEKPSVENFVFLHITSEKGLHMIEQAHRYALDHHTDIFIFDECQETLDKSFCGTQIVYNCLTNISIEEWLGYLYYAQYIFTDSSYAAAIGLTCGKNMTADCAFLPSMTTSDESVQSGYIQEKCNIIENLILTTIEKAAHKISTPSSNEQSNVDNLIYPVRFCSYSELPDTDEHCIHYQSNNFDEFLKTDYGYIYQPKDYYLSNDGTSIPLNNPFTRDGYHFLGWNILVKINTCYFWYLQSGGLVPQSDYKWHEDAQLYRFFNNQAIPHLPLKHIKEVILCASWEKNNKENAFNIYYYTAKPHKSLSWKYDQKDGQMVRNPSGSYEYRCTSQYLYNDGSNILKPNAYQQKDYIFSGWKIRVKIDGQWYWYMSDGTLQSETLSASTKNFASLKAILPDQGTLPCMPMNNIRLVIAEAVWTPQAKQSHLNKADRFLHRLYHKLLK